MLSGTTRPEVLSGRYELRSRLGRGGMGEVYAAYDRRLERRVAVKILRADWADEPAMCRRFATEARAAARLTHPNVVAIFDTGFQDAVPYLVMECLSGPTVADAITDGPMTEVTARTIGLDVLAALAAAHDAGIVHRDVKPGNVLLDDDGHAKVTDFGIAKIAEGLDQTQTAMVLGTPVYMAPERFHGAPATPRSDIYSLGVILYEALSGRKPYGGENPMAVAHRVEKGQRPALTELRPGLSPWLVAVVDRALSKDPDARFESADAMADALVPPAIDAEVVDDEVVDPEVTEAAMAPTRAAPPVAKSAPDPAPPPVRRPRLFPAVLAILLLGAASAFVGWSAVQSRDGTGSPAEAPVETEGLPPALRDALLQLEEAVQP
jgi:eukaryotic-like serine/threonine-protein kinase